MAYVFKVSKPGYDVNKAEGELKLSSAEDRKRFVQVFVLPYSNGAIKQIQRFKENCQMIATSSNNNNLFLCIHDISCLFEDLATVSIYMRDLGHDHSMHNLFIAARTLIRHDIRENFDYKDPQNSHRKEGRLKKLRVPGNLQMDLEFDLSYIKIGDTKFDLATIKSYLMWANIILSEGLNQIYKDGNMRIENK